MSKIAVLSFLLLACVALVLAGAPVADVTLHPGYHGVGVSYRHDYRAYPYSYGYGVSPYGYYGGYYGRPYYGGYGYGKYYGDYHW